MKTVLCYGDSNTWGYDPDTQRRHAPSVRWPGVMAQMLGETYHVVENGVGGRSALWDSPYADGLNGKSALIYALLSARPIDLMIIMLGTNDLNYTDAKNVARAQQSLIAAARGISAAVGDALPVFTEQKPKFLLVSPPHLSDCLFRTRHTIEPYFTQAESEKLSLYYQQIADIEQVFFLDAAQYAAPSETDGIHLPADAHSRLGGAMAAMVRSIFEE